MIQRLKMAFDRSITVSNALDKAIAAYGEDFEVLRFSGDLSYLGVNGQCLTLQELRKVANRLSNLLKGLGIKRFDRVAIYKTNGVEYLILSLAIYRCGAISVPINGKMPTENLKKYLQHTGCSALFVDANTSKRITLSDTAFSALTVVNLGESSVVYRANKSDPLDIRVMSDKFEAVRIHAHDDVIIVHTSGTTGFPKGVLHGSHSLITATQNQLKIQPATRKDRILLGSPTNHHITQAAVFANLLAGITGYVPHTERAGELLNIITRERISLVLAFPDIYAEMCTQDLTHFDLSPVRIWMAGGDSSHEAHIRTLTQQGAFLRVLGKPLIKSAYVEFFGTSEVGFAALLKTSFSFTRRFNRYVGKPGIFSPRVKVADDEGNELPAGTPGRLMVKGPTLFKGYWNAHDRLHGVYINHWWWTGDIVYRDARGRFYHLDRAVDVIETKEGPVYSLPIEETLLKIPSVFEVVVVAQDNEDAQRPLILVQPKPGQRVKQSAVRAALAEKMPRLRDYALLIMEENGTIPRGLTGKVLKRQLRDTHGKFDGTNGKAPMADCA